MATNAVALSVGAVILAGLSLLTGEKWSLPTDARTWATFGYLVVIGAVLFNYLWLFVLARWPATKAAYGPVLFPIVRSHDCVAHRSGDGLLRARGGGNAGGRVAGSDQQVGAGSDPGSGTKAGDGRLRGQLLDCR